MADSASSNLGLPWLWIIEYLSSFEQIETSMLHDLIEKAPQLPDDLGKDTREMVALRCLEDLFASNSGPATDSSSIDSRVSFEVTESCEDVLQCILQEIPASELKMAEPALLKWDVQPFVIAKRASMRKCALQELKDTIVQSTHTFANSLKEISGLVHFNESTRPPVNGNYLALTWRPDGSGDDAQTIAAEMNLITITSGNGNELTRVDLPNRNESPYKRNRSDLVTESPEHAKKLKRDVSCANQSVGLMKKSQMEGLKEGSFPADDHGEHAGAEDFEQTGPNDDKICQLNGSDIASDAHRMLQDASGVGACQHIVDETIEAEPRTSSGILSPNIQEKVCVHKAKDRSDHNHDIRLPNAAPSNGSCLNINADEVRGDVEHLCEDEMLNDGDEYQGEQSDVSMKKNNLLTSLFTHHDSLTSAGWTDQNLCVKCNKDGELLACSTSSCPLAVHEKCMGSPAQFDDKGCFYCPFCAYSLAISNYLEAKKKASLARKNLAAFIHKGFGHCPLEVTQRRRRKEHSGTRQSGEEDFVVKACENTNLGHNEESQNEQYIYEVNDHLNKSVSDKKQSDPSALGIDVNLSDRNEEIDVTNGSVGVSSGEKEGKETMLPECCCVGGLQGLADHASADPECHDDSISLRNEETAPASQRQDVERIFDDKLEQSVSDSHKKPVCALNIDGEETSEDDNVASTISKYSIRFRRRERHFTYPSIPQLRRKKLTWTAAEEKILKMGVQKFSSANDKSIPWKKILEFGNSVFLGGRTAIDLKDKWRNMCKGSPKPK